MGKYLTQIIVVILGISNSFAETKGMVEHIEIFSDGISMIKPNQKGARKVNLMGTFSFCSSQVKDQSNGVVIGPTGKCTASKNLVLNKFQSISEQNIDKQLHMIQFGGYIILLGANQYKYSGNIYVSNLKQIHQVKGFDFNNQDELFIHYRKGYLLFNYGKGCTSNLSKCTSKQYILPESYDAAKAVKNYKVIQPPGDMVFIPGIVSAKLVGNANRSSSKSDLLIMCKEGNGDACFDLAFKFAYKNNDTEGMFKYLATGCNFKHARSCFNLGVLFEKEKNLKAEARLAYEKACQFKYGSACYNLGNFASKIGDSKKAWDYHKKACDYGQELGCKHIKSVSRDMEIAVDGVILSKVCIKKVYSDCFDLAEELFNQGYYEMAKENAKYMCSEENNRLCFQLGFYYHKTNDLKNAEKYYKIACDKTKNGHSCFNLAVLMAETKKPRESNFYLNKSCELKYQQACDLISKMNSGS